MTADSGSSSLVEILRALDIASLSNEQLKQRLNKLESLKQSIKNESVNEDPRNVAIQDRIRACQKEMTMRKVLS
jgi:hypothetical protein